MACSLLCLERIDSGYGTFDIWHMDMVLLVQSIVCRAYIYGDMSLLSVFTLPIISEFPSRSLPFNWLIEVDQMRSLDTLIHCQATARNTHFKRIVRPESSLSYNLNRTTIGHTMFR